MHSTQFSEISFKQKSTRFSRNILHLLINSIATPTELFYGDKILLSARGVQQGDPFGPLFFCLVTRELSKSLQSPFNCWYLDDATIGSDLHSVLEDLELVMEQCASVGLEVNMSKCEIFVFGGSKADQQQDKAIARASFPAPSFPSSTELTLLGAPVLPEAVPATM